MDITPYIVQGLALLGGLQVVLKALIVIIPGDKDDKILGPVIAFLEKAGGFLSVKPKQ
jgi:hypothetical protein